ncbi:hypothetical protein, conserved [Eimeria praecox]|uniref:Uncharacterized protein n=1 Tax=Eimeria praecox TaxID=51316 RepID=U6GHZ5_9EIME|nr:hypothetical protein, conserved [Eimeria praecox]
MFSALVGEHKEVPIQGRSGPLCPSAPCCAITDIANANSCSNPSLKEAAHQSPAPPLPDQQETEAVEKTTAKDSTGGHNSVAILPRALPSQGFSHAALNSQFFSLAGDPSDARQVLGARSATVVLDGSEAKETGVAADESHLQAQQADNTVGSERVNSPEEQTGGCSSQHTATPATFGFNNNNYRGNNESLSSSSPDPPGEMLRLLLAGVPAGVSEAQRSSSSSAAPSSSSCVTSKSSSPFAASREQQQFDLRDFNTATAAVAPRRAEAQAPKPPLSRSGKRQQTVDPLSMLGSVLKSKKTRASSLPELDEQLSVAIAELVETSPELQEIFYYATTDPAAIEVPL